MSRRLTVVAHLDRDELRRRGRAGPGGYWNTCSTGTTVTSAGRTGTL